MKKFGKFVFATLSLAAIAGGAFYFVKNIINKDSDDDFDDFEDDFDDFDLDDETEESNTGEPREYVTLSRTEATNSEELAEGTLEEDNSEETMEEIPGEEDLA